MPSWPVYSAGHWAVTAVAFSYISTFAAKHCIKQFDLYFACRSRHTHTSKNEKSSGTQCHHETIQGTTSLAPGLRTGVLAYTLHALTPLKQHH